MRHFFKIILCMAAILVLPLAGIARKTLPADTHMLVEKRYSGWSGALRAWVAADWSCESGFIRWLDECAARFEKAHEGVRIEFAYADSADMNALFDDDVPPPELVFVSPGLIRVGEGFAELPESPTVRAGLRIDARAIPVAMGGYICAANANAQEESFEIPTDGARRYSEAAEFIIEEISENVPIDTEDGGMDLGLEVFSQTEITVSESAFDDFVSGKARRTIITQKELSRLIAMREAGRGPDWTCAVSGQRTLCDQLLLGAIPKTDAARMGIARTFIEWLLEDECQCLLSKIGAFGVTAQSVYPEYSGYEPMERLLRTRIPVVPATFADSKRIS